LLIIAFTYNVLSSEKEQGSLRLLASQPISVRKWVFQKLILRFFWLSILITLSLYIVFLIVGIQALDWLSVLSLLGLTLCYMLFWFALAFLVNLFVDSSAKNAVSLIMLWVIFVLLTPSVLNQTASTLYPMPSRTILISEMREHKAEATKKQDEILDNFLRDHPEYAINDSTQSRNFYHRYMASQKIVKEELEPIVGEYEDQLQKQQEWSRKLQWLSPAIVVQESLNQLAGTSTADYENYRGQVIEFAETWRTHLITFLYNNATFSQQDYASLPQFTYSNNTNRNVGFSSVVLLLIAAALLIFGFAVQGRSEKKGMLSQ
jgi:ABC-2 type transport system permease protein